MHNLWILFYRLLWVGNVLFTSWWVLTKLDTTRNTCENLSSIGRRSCKIIMKEKTPLSRAVVCFQMLDFDTSISNSEGSKSNTWKTIYFSKTTLLQREPFLTMFYTIISSPLLVTKYVFMLAILLSNYQYSVQCL